MGRKPNTVVIQYFQRGPKLNDSSNRYEHTCKACGQHFPKGRIDSMQAHLLKQCTAISPMDRQKALIAWNASNTDGSQMHDGQIQLHGPTVDLPIAPRNWTPLETLAEASRQIGLSEKHVGPSGSKNGSGGRSSEPRADKLELHEHYTPDNPPVSYEKQKKHPQEKTNRRESNHSMPGMNYQPQMVDSRSSSPNLAMAASSMAAAAAARFIPSMVDPQLLDESHVAHEAQSGKSIEQALNEATAAYSESSFHESPGNQQLTWSMLDMGNSYQQESEQVDEKVESNEMPRTTYTPIAMNPSMTTEFSAEYGNGERTNKQKSRGRFTPDRRKEVQNVRKMGACLRCRMLKKPCSAGTPCKTCQSVETARVWKTPCIRTKLWEVLKMYSSHLHVSLAYHETSSLKGRVVFKQSACTIEASQYPETTVFATFNTLHGQVQKEGNIDPGLGAEINSSSLRILDEANDDLPSKLEAYMKRISNVFYDREPSRFMRITLATAHALAIQSQDALLARVLELWSIVHILVDHEISWTMSERVEVDAQPGTGPLIDQASNNSTFNILCLQLNAAAEKKAASICKSVLNELEKRLLNKASSNTFETFLVAIVMLNCVEKSTWLYKSWEQESFKPRWPLDKTPDHYASQGEKLTKLLALLLSTRNIPPKTYTREDGVLACDSAPAPQEYFEKLQLSYADVLNKQANHTFDASNPRCYELRFCSYLLLPSTEK
ncbi:hypothetical protein BDZ45DRAFT_623103 [Acephala macrosclerotiorum]|nr:hypothetical protein BDZ45DRAFT_623103 [Acephala macrosclerotiorum]